MSDFRRNTSVIADESPSIMTNSLASTLSSNFFGGGSVNRREAAAANEESSQRSKAAIISKATATAISAARSIILTGGSHASAISTARAAAYSILSPSHERKPGFLTRRKNKQQAQVIANMAVVTVANTLETMEPNEHSLSDPTVVFMEQQNRSLSKGNTTASTTDDLSWQKNFTRTESHPETTANARAPVDDHDDDEEEDLGDASFITCQTPTSCNSTTATPFGYFHKKQTRPNNTPQMGRKMQLDIIESQDKSCESEDDSSYSEENSTLCESGSEGADTRDFTTSPTDYTEEDERDDLEEDDHRLDERKSQVETEDDTDDSDSDDDDEEDEDDNAAASGRRAMVPAQLHTTNLFDDQILATLTDLCTPSNAEAVSPPSSQRRGAALTFAFDTRDDVDGGEVSDNTDGNGSSMLGSFFLTNELRDDHSLDAGQVAGIKTSNAAQSIEASSKQDSGIEQVVLRALASSILPSADDDGKKSQVDETLKTIGSQSQPSSPTRFQSLQCTLPGTFIRNDPQSVQQHEPNVGRSIRAKSSSQSRSRLYRRSLSPRHRSVENEFSRGEPSPATTMKKSNTSAWFRWKKRHGQKAAF